MNRITSEEMSRIKKDIDLADLVRSSGVELKPHGENLIGLCPFHNDTNPSLVITPKKNLWNCLGACQTGGSVIDWMMKLKNLDFKEAAQTLNPDKRNERNHPTMRPQSNSSPEHPSKLSLSTKADDQVLLTRVIDYYHQALKKTPSALKYLEKRGLVHPELINHFKLGFADRTLGVRLADKNSQEGIQLRERLIRLGVFRKSGHEHFNGSLVIPVIDSQNQIKEIYGRKTGSKLRKGTALHLYTAGEHKGIFNPACLISESIILCESLIDALSFWACGFRNVTTSFGINGFTEEIKTALVESKAKKILIAYDSDEAGNSAAEKVAEKLSEQGLECSRIQFPNGDDANSFILNYQTTEERTQALDELIQGARPFNLSSLAASVQKEGVETSGKLEKETDLEPEPPPVPNALPNQGRTSTKEKPLFTYRIEGREIKFKCGDRLWRVRGLFKNLSFEILRVNVRISVDETFHIDTLDLYQSKPRSIFISTAATETGLKNEIIKKDLGKILLQLETLLESHIKQALKPKEPEVILTATEQQEAISYLGSKDLLSRVAGDFKTCGVAGESVNCKVGYLASISRKLEKPLAIIIQSSSSAGKSTLMESILSFVPEEDQIRFTAMTGQSLFYMGEKDLVHKILAISEEEGAERAQYAIKTLQSEQQLKIASTGKDPKTGKLEIQEYKVEGPTQLMLTTTNVEIDEELQNRCLILSVDESKQQTEAIHRRQREMKTLEGLIFTEKKKNLQHIHQNMQRMLKPLAVVNPYAKTLNFPSHLLRLRRDHAKYLCLIRCIALLHQHQREANEPLSKANN